MSAMADPMDALKSYQQNVDSFLGRDDLFDGDYLQLNGPKGHGYTYEYIKIIDGEVRALAIFGLEEPHKGIPRFSVGYAVAENHRRRGLAVEVFNKGIDDLKKEAARKNFRSFYVEALIAQTNAASIQLAKKLFPGDGVAAIDEGTGTPALLFYKLIKI